MSVSTPKYPKQNIPKITKLHTQKQNTSQASLSRSEAKQVCTPRNNQQKLKMTWKKHFEASKTSPQKSCPETHRSPSKIPEVKIDARRPLSASGRFKRLIPNGLQGGNHGSERGEAQGVLLEAFGISLVQTPLVKKVWTFNFLAVLRNQKVQKFVFGMVF